LLVDTFDMFENPHGLDNFTEDDRQQLKLLYGGKKFNSCFAKFPPKSSGGTYYSTVSDLQYIFIRDYVNRSIVKRVSLMYFPTAIHLADYSTYERNGGQAAEKITVGGEEVLAIVGTREGKIINMKVGTAGHDRIGESEGAVLCGAVTKIAFN